MRFERLLLRAFGPFTDECLDLSGGAPGGLHVIYGPNEAGKSTSLRAVTGLLFGIPHRTPDAHLHPGNRLSITAEISAGGQTVEVTRLKRRKDDLVGPDGAPLANNPLPALLANLDQVSFTSRFGLDQAELERGAEALLGGSEQGLFAAGTAGVEARRVLDELGARTEELFKARGTKPLLNVALSNYENAARDAKRAERPPEKWLEQKRAHEEAKARAAAFRKQRNEVRAELRRLNRLRGLMSDLTAWEAATTRRQELGDERPLPENATELRQASERTFQEAMVEARRIRQELSAFEHELAQLPPESALVEVDDEQLKLGTRIGTAISARSDLPKREASLLEQQRQIREFLSDLGRTATPGEELEVARELIPSPRTVSLVRALLAEQGALVTAVLQAKKSHGKQQLELDRMTGAREESHLSPVELARLEAVLADAQADQALLSVIREEEDKLAHLEGRLSLLRAEHGGVRDWRQIAALLPGSEKIASAVGRYRGLLDDKARRVEDLSRRRLEVEHLGRRVLEQEESDLPSEEKLVEARALRDGCVAQLEEGAPVLGAATLREAILLVDQLSDRLRREADRVAAASALARQLEGAQAEISSAHAALLDVEEKLSASRAAHAQLCDALGVGLAPEPEHSASLFEGLRALIECEAESEAMRVGLIAKRRTVESLTARLMSALSPPPSGAGFAGLISAATKQARESLQAFERAQNRRDGIARLKETLGETEADLVRAEFELSKWEGRWEEAVRPLGLERGASVATAQDVLSTLEKMKSVHREAESLEGRILGMQRDTLSLANDVRAVVRRHLPALLDTDPVEAARQLQEAIAVARKVRDERARYRDLIQARRAALADIEVRVATSEGQLAQLVAAACVKDVTELPLAEEQRREIRTLEAKREALEKSIRERSDGASLSELRAEADEWKGRGRHLVEKVDELDDQYQELEEELRAAESDEEGTRRGLEIYSSEEPVDARQRATLKEAEARAYLREYLVQKTAHELLAKQVENYAERFAGPIAGRAGQLFERMTLGRYTKLSIGVGERTLRCVRDGQELEVEQLSRGTRAQLYFSLRLASLESYFAQAPALPLVFDDLLVDFDDDRATAAFEILAELAEKVQVLYFTHLARDVEAAHNAVGSNLLFEHRLAAS